jgi:hypothetical protein
VTLNGVKMFGGVVAAPVFKDIATETLRLMGVPKDLPETEPEPADPSEAYDLAIADMSRPPKDLPPLPQPPPEVAPEAPAAHDTPGTDGTLLAGTVPSGRCSRNRSPWESRSRWSAAGSRINRCRRRAAH